MWQPTVLRQLIECIPAYLVTKLARKHGVDEQARTFIPWSHVNDMRLLCAELKAGEIVLFDKGYHQLAHFAELTQRGVFFVTRPKEDLLVGWCVDARVWDSAGEFDLFGGPPPELAAWPLESWDSSRAILPSALTQSLQNHTSASAHLPEILPRKNNP